VYLFIYPMRIIEINTKQILGFYNFLEYILLLKNHSCHEVHIHLLMTSIHCAVPILASLYS
jgi:hypothetical protein